MLKCHGADLQDRPSRSTCTALHFGVMIARPVRRVAFHRPRTRCLFAQVDSPRAAAPVVRAQRRHSRRVAFRVVCSAHRPIVRLLVLPRALKHLSYAPHRARFALRLGLGFLGWRTPHLRCEYNRPTNEWARNFFTCGSTTHKPYMIQKALAMADTKNHRTPTIRAHGRQILASR